MRSRGATLALTVAGMFILAVVGLGIFCMIKLFGGARELQALTDSGTLNLGKGMIAAGTPLNQSSQTIQFQYMYYPYWGVPFIPNTWQTPMATPMTLPTGIEGTSFPYLIDSNGNITLQNYNRIIAQTMLIGFNAQAEGTMPAAANAQTLYDAVQRLSTSVSQRLVVKLSDPATSSSMFLNAAAPNSLRMLGSGSSPNFQPDSYGVSYYSPGDCTNVWIDPTILPPGITMPSGSLSASLSPANFPYLTGYTEIDTGAFSIEGTPVFPGQQPHLISLRDFQSSTASPLQSGYVAPNSFGAACTAPDSLTPMALSDHSASVVGVLGQEYPAGIPEGYVVFHNIIGDVTGNLPQMLSTLSPADKATVMNGLIQRLREIMPSWSNTQILSFLNTAPISHNPNLPTYMYLYPDPNNPLYPAWHQKIVQAGVPEGTPNQLYASTVPPPTFPTNPTNIYYGVTPDGLLTKYQAANFQVHWSPSSGFQNLLGMLGVP